MEIQSVHTAHSKNDVWITISIIISTLGLVIHNYLEFGWDGLFAPENGTIPMMIVAGALFIFWWGSSAPRRAGLRLLAGLGLLYLLGGAVISVLPLGILPFEPEQTLAHYVSHAIYGVAQLPLIWLTIQAMRKSRQQQP